ncbi:MAG TPA: adenylate/guanylate cyclase domain-containing protein [Bacteroidota bacterium]|nr:adenylate/guanylate cyclase domain-containing protein [Bacteroidota bacterium]
MATIKLNLDLKKSGVALGFALGTVILTYILFNTTLLLDTLGTDIFRNIEQKGYDALMRVRGERPHAGDVVMIRIDEYTIQQMNYPIPRDQIGAVMTLLSRPDIGGAKAVALDIFSAEPTEKEIEEAQKMVEMLRATQGTFQIIGPFIPAQTSREAISARDVDSTAHHVIGRFGIPAPPTHSFFRAPLINDFPFKELADVSTGVGDATLHPSPDGSIRSVPAFVEYAGRLYPTLGLALALHTLKIRPNQISFTTTEDGTTVKAGPITFDTDHQGDVLINYIGPYENLPSVSFYDVLQAFRDQDMQFFEQFKNKVCIIGPTARAVGDYYPMPFSERAPGYVAHANVYDMIVTNNFIYPATGAVQFVILLLITIGISFVANHRPMKTGTIALVILTVVYFTFAYFAFAQGNTWYNVIEPVFAMFTCFLGTVAYRAATEGKQKRMITNMFEKYVDRAVVRELINDPTKMKLGGEMREVTLLFSDVKGFTTISETLGPENLVKLLNVYLTEMTNIIMRNRGSVDKFIGDAIMAFWGAPLPDPDAPFHACLAALEMQAKLDSLAPRWRKFGDVTIKQRVGINTGLCVVGNMGSDQKFNYTAMGDSVNLASRLEGVNKQYGTYILISEMTYLKVAKKVVAREIDKVIVVGKTEPVRIYELIAAADRPLSDNMKYFLDSYREGITCYHKRQWDEGIAYMEHAMQYKPEDPVCQLYIDRMQLYKLNPPDANWSGVFVLQQK